jgi:hypothetical protein
MLVREIFSELYEHSFTKENPTWELKCNCINPKNLQQVDTLFQYELMSLFKINNASEKVIPIINKHIDQIIERKNSSKLAEHKEVYSYLQLTWGICAVTQLNWDGEFIYCYEIFMKSVFDKSFQNGETYDLNDIKILNFINSKNDYISKSKSVINQWFSQLYYYSKSFSGLNEWCEFYFDDIYYDLNENLIVESYHPQFLSNLLSWCEVNLNWRGSRAIRNIISREFNFINWSKDLEENDIKCQLGLQLLLCKDYYNNNKRQLFIELDKHNDLHPLTKMQGIIALCYDGENLNSNYDLLINAFTKFNEYIENDFPDIISSTYQRARIFKNVLNTCIASAIELERGDIIDDLLIAYYNITNPQPIGTVIYFIPNQEKRVTFCLPTIAISDVKKSQKIIIEVVDIENKAFNTFRLLKGGFNKEIIPTGKPIGLPNPNFANEYESKLLELYDFGIIENQLENVGSLIQFDFNSFPIQALMLKSIKKTLPINLSLSNKLDFTKIETVLYWSGNSQTSEIETEALNEIFYSKNIIFEIHNEENSSLNKFVDRIKQINPDVIWISSHGEYQHYEPNLSKIHLTENFSIGIRDFKQLINNSDKRRLLFLNVCEGGVHSQTGEFKNLGFPNLLVSNNQDVISHLWMADSRFAYVFGVFIALGIAHLEKNYFEAFNYSLSIVLDSKDSILNNLDEFPLALTNLKERIQNNDGTEWGNIITTGSPVYNI